MVKKAPTSKKPPTPAPLPPPEPEEAEIEIVPDPEVMDLRRELANAKLQLSTQGKEIALWTDKAEALTCEVRDARAATVALQAQLDAATNTPSAVTDDILNQVISELRAQVESLTKQLRRHHGFKS